MNIKIYKIQNMSQISHLYVTDYCGIVMKKEGFASHLVEKN